MLIYWVKLVKNRKFMWNNWCYLRYNGRVTLRVFCSDCPGPANVFHPVFAVFTIVVDPVVFNRFTGEHHA